MIYGVNKKNSFDGLDRNYKGALNNTSWSLCVGAGVSIGLVPSWQELTRLVVNDAYGTTYNDAQFADVVNTLRWSMDALASGGRK